MPSRGTRQRDELVGFRVARRRVLERRPDAQRALLHERIDDRNHARELGGGGCAVFVADHCQPHLRRAHERGKVEARSLALELREVAVEIAPVLPIVPLLHRVGVRQDQPVGQRCHRAAFPRHLRRDALRDLGEDTVVDEHVELGLPHHIDETRSDDEAADVYGVAGRRLAEESNGRDAVTADADVAPIARVAAAVDDPTVL